MPLTNEQLHEIREIIQDKHLAFIVNTLGISAVSPEIVERLKEKGYINVTVGAIEEAYRFGQVMADTDDKRVAKMDQEEFKRHVQKNPIALTDIEQRAIHFAQQQAGQFVVGLGNKINQETGQLLIDADAALRSKTRRIIRDVTAEGIAKRESIEQIKSKLGHATKDWARNWNRIAVTEKHSAMQRGVADSLADRFGPDVRVAKRPTPDACEHCNRLYLGPDGQPRIFKLSELEANGLNNFGRKTAEWMPVVGPMHPHCQCQLIRIPAGWGFDEDGSLVPGGEMGVEAGSDLIKTLELEMEMRKSMELQGRLTFQGLPIAIENKVGTKRYWTDDEGNKGHTVMVHAYGYIEGTNGADDDEIDVFIGPDPEAKNAFIVHQKQLGSGTYDEDKVMLGFSSAAHARVAYTANFNRPDFYVSMSPMEMEAFKRWALSTKRQTGEMMKGKSTRILTIPVSDGELRKSAEREAGVSHVLIQANSLIKAGPFIGPRGGKWADAQHTIPWKEAGSEVGRIIGDVLPESNESWAKGRGSWRAEVYSFSGSSGIRIKSVEWEAKLGKRWSMGSSYDVRDGLKAALGEVKAPPGHQLVYRIGEGRETLNNVNAGNLDGVTDFLMHYAEKDYEVNHGSKLTVYAVKMPKTFVKYQAFVRGQPSTQAFKSEGVRHVRFGAVPSKLRPPKDNLEKGGPFIGPKGGKWADAQHTIPWKEQSSKQSVADLEKKLRKKYGVQLWLSDRGESFSLEKIVVEKRGEGVGSKVMQALVDYADKHGKIITASPSSDFGGTKSRVVKFNKKFGFTDNKGRKKDYRFKDTMIRLPDLAKATGPREFRTISGTVPAFVAAANSPAGNRNPGQGTVINQLVGARKAPVPMMEDLVPSAREWVEAHEHVRDRGAGQSRNRDDFEFQKPLNKPVEKFVVPDGWGTKPTPDEIETNRTMAEKDLLDKQAGNRNRADVSDDDSKEQRSGVGS